MNPVEFLITLWGQRPPRGVIQLWDLARRHSSYLKAPAGAASAAGATDIYTCVSLAAKSYGHRHRARAEQSIGIAGLWLDVDVIGGPDKKTGAAPTQAEAVALTRTILEPTLIVNSGHGIHAWWLLEQPWCFANRDEQATAMRMSAQWHHLHRARARENQWSLDHTQDLARLLRLPGTLNGKGGQAIPVDVLEHTGQRHPRTELAAAAAAAGDIEVVLTTDGDPAGGALPDIVVRDANIDQARLEALRVNLPDFNKSWMHARGNGWSLSEYDLSIASFAAQAGWNDQEVADLIVLHRRTWDPTDRKAGRRDYLRRTVAKARHAGDRAGAAQRLAARAARRAA